MERTLGIIKPDAVKRNLVGAILERGEADGLEIKAIKMLRLTKQQAMGFYHVHRGKPFFDPLTTFMSAGPIIVLVWEAEDAISRWRKTMGATNPSVAEEGSIRRLFGESLERNSVHGSDSPESAAFEIAYFYSASEVVG